MDRRPGSPRSSNRAAAGERRGGRSSSLEAERARVAALLATEEAARAGGARFVAGVDEAGRGALAGPVFAAAVVLPPGRIVPGIDDSKALSPEVREALAPRIRLGLRLPGASARPRRRRSTASASHPRRSSRCGGRSTALAAAGPGPDLVLVDGFPIPSPADSAEGRRPRRRDRRLHRGGVDPREDGARRGAARARPREPVVRLRRPQGLRERRPPRRSAASRTLARPSPDLRGGPFSGRTASPVAAA